MADPADNNSSQCFLAGLHPLGYNYQRRRKNVSFLFGSRVEFFENQFLFVTPYGWTVPAYYQLSNTTANSQYKNKVKSPIITRFECLPLDLSRVCSNQQIGQNRNWGTFVGFLLDERAYSLKSSLHSISSKWSNWSLYKRINWPVVIQTWAWPGNLRPAVAALEQGCGNQTPSATIFFFRTNLVRVLHIEM